MIHPSLAAADLRRPDDVYAKGLAWHIHFAREIADLPAPRDIAVREPECSADMLVG
jgi:hypothetical protein